MFSKWLRKLGYLLLTVFIFLNVMMASQAYHLTHFFNNVPKPPKPEEMGIGSKTKAVLFGMSYPKSKVVDSLPIPHDTLRIQTEDSLQLECWHMHNDTVPVKGTVLMFHGHGSNKSAVIREAKAFYSMGWNVLLTDFRAHGNSAGEVCTIGANEAKDVKAVYEYAREKLQEKNIVIWGISLGASTTLHAMAQYNIKPNRVILEMPFATLHDAVKGRLRMMNLPAEPFAGLLTFWGGVEQGFWAFNLQPAEDAHAVSCPVLLQWGFKDPRVTEAETDKIFANLGTNQRTLMKYYQSGHESLLKKEPEKWRSMVGEFLMSK